MAHHLSLEWNFVIISFVFSRCFIERFSIEDIALYCPCQLGVFLCMCYLCLYFLLCCLLQHTLLTPIQYVFPILNRISLKSLCNVICNAVFSSLHIIISCFQSSLVSCNVIILCICRIFDSEIRLYFVRWTMWHVLYENQNFWKYLMWNKMTWRSLFD